VEECADATLSMLLNLFRRTHWLANSVQTKLANAKQSILSSFNNSNANGVNSSNTILNSIIPSTPEQTRDLAQGCLRLRGQTLGIVGFGKIGIAVAQRAKAFGFNILFFDPFVTDGLDKSIGGVTRCSSLNDLLSQSDCVTLHAQLNEQTYHLLNESTFKLMKQGSFLINTAQSALVDEMALANALKYGPLKGAALDVFQVDSFHPLNGPLKDAPNLIVTPHTSFYSDVSSKEMREMAAQEVRRGLLNKTPLTLLFCEKLYFFLGAAAPATAASSSNSSTVVNGNNHNLLNNLSNTNNNNNNSNNSNNSNNGLSNSNSSNNLNNSNNNNNSNNRSGNSPANLLGASMGNSSLTAASLLSANSNLNSSNQNAQLLAQLNYLKNANFDQFSAAAALNGMPPSFLSYFNPLNAAAAVAAAASSSSSPSPSPTSSALSNLQQQQVNSLSSILPPGLMSSSQSNSVSAALTAALMDPLLSKQAQAQLVAAAAAAAAQQQNFLMPEIKSDNNNNNNNNNSNDGN
jgi:phosphoglycerate dehydrogenase-like enzyme